MSLRLWGQSAGPLGAAGAQRLQDGDAVLPSFMDSVVLQEGAGGASGFVALGYTFVGNQRYVVLYRHTHTGTHTHTHTHI